MSTIPEVQSLLLDAIAACARDAAADTSHAPGFSAASSQFAAAYERLGAANSRTAGPVVTDTDG